MQIEVKLLLDSAEGYQRTILTLANHHLKDECYYDLFFDFPYAALQERSSVLRLRVPCNPACVDDRPATSPPSPGASGNNNYDPEAEYDAFMRACRGEGSLGTKGAGDSSSSASPHAVGTTLSMQGDDGSLRGLPTPLFIPGAPGKLVLKQKNTVEQGHQMSFVVEDAHVPSAVVESLVQLVPRSLLTGAPSASAGVDGVLGDIFPILSAYAQQHPLNDDGTGESAIARILSHLTDVARSYAPYHKATELAPDVDNSNAHFTQVRFAAMGASTVYTQQQIALSQGSSREGRGRPGADGRSDAATLCPQLVAVAGFMTLRKLFAYAPLIALQQGTNGALELTGSEMEFREGLRIRLDVSYILPGLTIYELEVPNCGVVVDEVSTEVSNFLRLLSVSFQKGSESKFVRYVQYQSATREAEQNANDVKLRLTNVNGYEEVRRNLEHFIQATSATSAEGSRDRRHISNTEVDLVDDDDDAGNDDSWWRASGDGYVQETNEDFFFDSPEEALRRGQSFLRLRKQHHSNKFVLVLKAHQAFNGGQQNSLSSKVRVCEAVARALLGNPTKFLHEHVEHFAVMRTVWVEFGVRELCRTAAFTTERLTVPWWSAQAQQPTFQRNWGGGALSALTQQQSQLVDPSSSYYLSQQQQQQHHHGYGAVFGLTPVPPLLIHLDRTVYRLPSKSQTSRIPFSQSQSWGARQCETYEMEVTNIMAPTEPKDVVSELTMVLNGLGVEWSVGVRSKLEQYFSLIEI
ncbi:hypothetical protein JKF63_05781 [Porcisia hertigi]|uniref:CYTH domain-containing protein n=1 Tax=Porcisia hertigi TaxID=2761500 RepID=A0A836LFY6_9TRYP|nr:hypothetical protein JKF63_05781 [Porcisia hertigi]